MKLDAASSLIITFYTPLGEMQTPENAFWIKDAQDIFEKKIDQAYKNCKGVGRIAGDVQVFGNKKRTRKEGIKQYFDKCFIKTKCYSL